MNRYLSPEQIHICDVVMGYQIIDGLIKVGDTIGYVFLTLSDGYYFRNYVK